MYVNILYFHIFVFICLFLTWYILIGYSVPVFDPKPVKKHSRFRIEIEVSLCPSRLLVRLAPLGT